MSWNRDTSFTLGENNPVGSPTVSPPPRGSVCRIVHVNPCKRTLKIVQTFDVLGEAIGERHGSRERAIGLLSVLVHVHGFTLHPYRPSDYSVFHPGCINPLRGSVACFF